MSAQGFCTVLAIPAPLAHAGGGTANLRIHVVSPLQLVWTAGSPDSISTGPVLSVYDGGSTLAGDQFVWLVVASQGASHLFALHEADFLTISSIGAISGPWALYARVDGDRLYYVPQI